MRGGERKKERKKKDREKVRATEKAAVSFLTTLWKISSELLGFFILEGLQFRGLCEGQMRVTGSEPFEINGNDILPKHFSLRR